MLNYILIKNYFNKKFWMNSKLSNVIQEFMRILYYSIDILFFQKRTLKLQFHTNWDFKRLIYYLNKNIKSSKCWYDSS